jgi:hypothetical protein
VGLEVPAGVLPICKAGAGGVNPNVLTDRIDVAFLEAGPLLSTSRVLPTRSLLVTAILNRGFRSSGSRGASK